MADVHNKQARSYNMSKIKGKNTKPELLVRKFLHSKGFRFRLHDSKLPGKPDLVLPKYKCVVHVNGCFWHKHKDCRYFIVPKTRTEWWMEKINRTVERDQKNEQALKSDGWHTIVVWECELKKGKRERTLHNLLEKITCRK